jgi:hypothetical protein
LITQNDSFGKNWGAKDLGKLLRIIQNVIKKYFINRRVLPLVKINTGISDTPCTSNRQVKFNSHFYFFINYLLKNNSIKESILFNLNDLQEDTSTLAIGVFIF